MDRHRSSYICREMNPARFLRWSVRHLPSTLLRAPPRPVVASSTSTVASEMY
jgi:hypothetical protein